MNENNKTKLAIVGSQGIPNQYGGFESLVEQLAINLSSQFDITIFCSGKDFKKRIPEIYGCKLIYLPFKANGAQSVPYDIVSMIKAVRTFDKVLVLGASGGIVMPFLKGSSKKIILNIGGIEWKRSKWSSFAKWFLKVSEAQAINNSGLLIADNEGIREYISKEYHRESLLVEYGGDQVFHQTINEESIKKYPFLNQDYALSVARIQSDNNIEMILEAYKEGECSMPIVFIGNWDASAFGQEMKSRYSSCSNIVLLDAIYDQKVLNLIRSNCALYVHGHSAGGTNPALVEAMNLCLPIICFASEFNRNTTEHKALYFNDSKQLIHLLNNLNRDQLSQMASAMKEIADRRYKWSIILEKYAACIEGRRG